MSKAWPKVRLGEVLRPVSREEPVDSLKEYRLLGVRLDGRGPFLRETVKGAQIAAKKLFRVAHGDFIYSRLFACRGAFGAIREELNGCYVSGEFPTFALLSGRIDLEFLRHWFCLPEVIARIDTDCSGSTPLTRNRFRERFFLALEIPLPPLSEQKRIVARVEKLATLINEVRTLRRQVSLEADALVDRRREAIFMAAAQEGTISLSEVAHLERGKFSHRPRNEPRFFGGPHPWIQIAQIENAQKYIGKWTESLNDEGLAISRKFPKGTILISIAATIGAVGILSFDCCVPDSIVGVTPKPGIESEFLYHFLGYARTNLETIAPQSAQKNINLQILGPLAVPKLSISDQRKIVKELDALQSEVDKLRSLQAKTAAELDAMLPAILDRAFNGES